MLSDSMHKMIRLSVVLLSLFVTVQTRSAEPNRRKIDSLQQLLRTTLPDTVKIGVLYGIADELWNVIDDKVAQASNFKTSREYAQQSLSLSERSGFKRGVADACYVLAGLSDDGGNSTEALEWGKKALQYYKDINAYKRVIKTLFALGIFSSNIGDGDLALNYYLEGLAVDERFGDGTEAAGIYHNVGMIYESIGNRKDAIAYTKKALSYNERSGHTVWLGTNYLTLGHYLSDYGNYGSEEALQYYINARKIFLANSLFENYGHALVGIGSVLSHLGRYSEAIDTLHQALSSFRKRNDINGIAWTYNHLGMSYTLQHKFREAGVCLDSCLRLCRTLGLGAMRNVYQRLYQLDSASGNLAQAYTHYRLYISHRDSLSTSESIQKVAKQQLRFEYEKKEERDQSEQSARDAQQLFVRNTILAGLVGAVAFLFMVYRQRNRIRAAHQKNEELLLNILPSEVAEELKEKGSAEARQYDNVTVLFTDFVSFTHVSERLSAQELVDELHTCFTRFDEICGKYDIEKVKTIGDAYLAVCGLPMAVPDHAIRVVNAAIEIRDYMRKRKAELGDRTFSVRIGINTGTVVAGIVGVKKFAYDIWGDTVNMAARMEQSSEAGRINISGSTYALVRDEVECMYRGKIDLKNKGQVDCYFVNTEREDTL